MTPTESTPTTAASAARSPRASPSMSLAEPCLAAPSRVITGDNRNKPDLAASISREWIDTGGVDLILDGASSGAGLAIQEVCREKRRVFIPVGPATSDLTGKVLLAIRLPLRLRHLRARTRHRRGDDASRAATLGSSSPPTTRSAPRYSATRRSSSSAAGGRVLGSVRHPLGTSDYSSFLLEAQASGREGHCVGERRHRRAERYQAGGRVRPDARRQAAPRLAC